MSSFTDGRAALVALQAYLQSTLTADYAATFAAYGGVDVVLRDDEPGEPERVGKPYIMLTLDSDANSEAVRVRNARDLQAGFDVVASEFSGARTGAANPEGSDTRLSRALLQIITDGYADLRALGLYNTRIAALPETVQDADGEPQVHTNPHRILLTYFAS